MAMSSQMSTMPGDEASDSDMMAAASLLMEESTDLSNFETQLFEEENTSNDLTTADLNTTSDFNEEQSTVDFAVASLQLEEDTPMVCTTEETNSSVGESVLVVSDFTQDSNLIDEPFDSVA
jgi:hypothetical protein